MRRFLVFALFGAAALSVGSLTAGDKKADENAQWKHIAKRMREVHRGDDSARRRIGEELKKDTPDWEQIAAGAKKFAGLGELLKGMYTGSWSRRPTRYIENAKALVDAADNKDQKAANEAFVGLNRSCTACHNPYEHIPPYTKDILDLSE